MTGIAAAPVPLRRNRDFILLWTGQLTSTVGSEVSALAFPLLVLALTESPAKAGIVGFAQTLPNLFLYLLPAHSPIAGIASGSCSSPTRSARLLSEASPSHCWRTSWPLHTLSSSRSLRAA